MSALTKVFAVLVSFLAVLVVAMIVPYAAKTEDAQQKIGDERRAKVEAEASARVAQAMLSQADARLAETTAGLRSQVNQLTSQVTMRSQELADARAEVQRERARAAKQEADVGRLAAAEQQHAEILRAYASELEQLRGAEVDRSTKLIEQAQRLNELISQLDAMERALRREREQRVASAEELDALKRNLASLGAEGRRLLEGGAASSAEPLAEPGLEGAITQVDRRGDETLVQINIGSADGVRQNMRFIVFRDNKYLGELVVEQVDERSAAGSLESVQDRVVEGDRVQTLGRS